MNNFQEIITTKVLIDEYDIESNAPWVKNAIESNLKYTKNKNDEKKDSVKFSMEQIIISDIVFIKDWEKYNNDFKKFIDREIQDINQTNLADDKKSILISSGPTNYKDPYSIAGSVGTCSIGRNSKYSKYLRKIGVNKFKINDYSYFVSIELYLNDATNLVFKKIVNSNSIMYYSTYDIYCSGTIDNDDLFYCYADIIKYEIIKNLKNDGLIIFADVDNPVYSLYIGNIDYKKCHNLGFLGINGDMNKGKTKEILINNRVMSSLLYWNFDKTKRYYSRESGIHFLSLLLGYYNLYNILLSINHEQLKIIYDDLHHNKINYKKIKSINEKYFILSGLINNYETSIFSGYSGLQFYDGAKYIKSETCVEEAYNSIKKVKKEFNNLYKDVTKIYDINRIHDDSCNSKTMLIVSIITLIVSFKAMTKNNYKSQKINEETYKQETLSNDDVMTVSSFSESRLAIVEDAALISSASETRLNVIR